MLDYNASPHVLFWFFMLEWEHRRLPLYFYSKSYVLQVWLCFVELDWFAAYEKECSERETLRKLKEKMNKKARREARIKKLKEEHGTTRWSIKRKVRV